MLAHRASSLVDILSRCKVNAFVGVETYPHAPADWTVMIAPQQVIDVSLVSWALHLRGFALKYGPVLNEDGTPTQQETWMLLDIMPTMIPEAEEVEEVGPDDFSRAPVYGAEGEKIGWRTVHQGRVGDVIDVGAIFEDAWNEEAQRQRDAMNKSARTGGESTYEPERGK